MEEHYQIITSNFWVFVYVNHRQVVIDNNGDTYQLRELFRNSFIILPIYWKRYIVPQVMTRGKVKTDRI